MGAFEVDDRADFRGGVPGVVYHQKLTVIPPLPPGQQEVTELVTKSTNPDFVFFSGAAKNARVVSHVCGNCERMLTRDVEVRSITKFVLVCPSCTAYNQFPEGHSMPLTDT